MNAPACPRCADHRTATFHVAEMDCAHEVAILEKRLGTLDGVVTLDADVLSRQLRVHYDGATLSAAGIAEAVAQAGMRAWPVTAGGDAPRVETGVPWALVVRRAVVRRGRGPVAGRRRVTSGCASRCCSPWR